MNNRSKHTQLRSFTRSILCLFMIFLLTLSFVPDFVNFFNQNFVELIEINEREGEEEDENEKGKDLFIPFTTQPSFFTTQWIKHYHYFNNKRNRFYERIPTPPPEQLPLV